MPRRTLALAFVMDPIGSVEIATGLVLYAARNACARS